MDVRNWPMDRIMQLPDHCFGARTEVVLAARLTAAQTLFVISPMALPDKCVIWQANFIWGLLGTGAAMLHCLVRVKFGDYLPVGVASYNMLEDVFKGFDIHAPERRVLRQPVDLTRIRKLVYPQGRRFVVSFEQTTIETMDIQASFVISSVPTEVPDCLLSV